MPEETGWPLNTLGSAVMTEELDIISCSEGKDMTSGVT